MNPVISPLRRPGARPRQPWRDGFTVTEVLVAMGIMGILSILLLSALPSVRTRSQAMRCTAQLKNISAAIQLFVAENNGCLPTNVYQNRWPTQVAPGMGFSNFSSATAFDRKRYYDSLRCAALNIVLPADSNSLEGTYAYHTDLGYRSSSATTLPSPVSLARIVNPSQKPMMACHYGSGGLLLEKDGPAPSAAQYGFGGTTINNGLSPNHGRFCNIVFFDGHLEAVDVTRSDAWPWDSANSLELFK